MKPKFSSYPYTKLKISMLVGIIAISIFSNCKKDIKSPAKDILSFTIKKELNTNLTADIKALIDGTNITVSVPEGTKITKLKPTIILSEKASVSPANEVEQDFTNPVKYNVMAQDGTTKEYTITITVKTIPLVFKYKSKDNSVDVSWTAESGATKYKVTYKTKSTELTEMAITTTTSNIPNIVYDSLYYVEVQALNDNATVLNSTKIRFTPSIKWTREMEHATWTPRSFLPVVVYNNKLWLFGGTTGKDGNNNSYIGSNELWSSSDGKTWEKQTTATSIPLYAFPTCVVFGSKIWLIGGATNDSFKPSVWSFDGTDWTSASATGFSSTLFFCYANVFNNKVWLYGQGGVYGFDGLAWTNYSYPVSQYSGQAVISYNNLVWNIGGFTATCNTGHDKVYSSTGPATDTWTRHRGMAGDDCSTQADEYWSGRGNHSVVEYGGKIWLMGGLRGNSVNLNDVWIGNGLTWQKQKVADWSARNDFGAVVFNDKIWVMGGTTDNRTTNLNDVWSGGIEIATQNGWE